MGGNLYAFFISTLTEAIDSHLFIYLFISEHISNGRCKRILERATKRQTKPTSSGGRQRSVTSWLTKEVIIEENLFSFPSHSIWISLLCFAVGFHYVDAD